MAGSEVETTWTAEPFVPESKSLRTLEQAARRCRGCPLYADAERVVFGEGQPVRHDRAGRRAAGRPGGSAGSSFRRTCGSCAVGLSRRSRHRPWRRVRHQRRQALQARAERQTAAAQETDRGGGRGLPSVDRGRACRGALPGHRGTRCHRCPVVAREIRSDRRQPWQHVPCARSAGARHLPPIGRAASRRDERSRSVSALVADLREPSGLGRSG